MSVERRFGPLTECEPQVEADDNHDDANDAASCQSRSEGHGPEHTTELLVSQ
jgi:hypothetical protein